MMNHFNKFNNFRIKRIGIKRKSSTDEPCIEDENYSLHRCVLETNAKRYLESKELESMPECKNVSGKG